MDPDGRSDDHRTFEDMAVAHVMGGLDQDQGRLFRAHLLDCGDCRARVGELRAIAHELAGIERDEQRVRSAQTVEMKSRERDDSDEEPPPPRRTSWLPRLAAFAALTMLIVLGSYVFTLRGQIGSLNEQLGQRLEASAALEHGDKLAVTHTAPYVTHATAKRHGDQVVALVEGLDDDSVYGLYLVDDSGESGRTILRVPHAAEDGRLFVLFGLQGEESVFLVMEPADGLPMDPSGTTVLEARLDQLTDE